MKGKFNLLGSLKSTGIQIYKYIENKDSDKMQYVYEHISDALHNYGATHNLFKFSSEYKFKLYDINFNFGSYKVTDFFDTLIMYKIISKLDYKDFVVNDIINDSLASEILDTSKKSIYQSLLHYYEIMWTSLASSTNVIKISNNDWFKKLVDSDFTLPLESSDDIYANYLYNVLIDILLITNDNFNSGVWAALSDNYYYLNMLLNNGETDIIIIALLEYYYDKDSETLLNRIKTRSYEEEKQRHNKG